jgi:hypothetical protein
VCDQAVADSNESAVAPMAHAFAEPHPVDPRKLFGRRCPGPFSLELEQSGHRGQGARLVDRGQTQIVEQTERLRADDRDGYSLLLGPHRLGQPNHDIWCKRFLHHEPRRDACV